MKEAIYSIARVSHVHESSKGLNSGFSFVLSSAAGRNRISEIRYITSNSTVFNILLKISIYNQCLSQQFLQNSSKTHDPINEKKNSPIIKGEEQLKKIIIY